MIWINNELSIFQIYRGQQEKCFYSCNIGQYHKSIDKIVFQNINIGTIYLKTGKQIKFEIYTLITGAARFNCKLSQNRKNIFQQLINHCRSILFFHIETIRNYNHD